MSDDPTSDEARAFEAAGAWWNERPDIAKRTHDEFVELLDAFATGFLAARAATPKPGEAMGELRAALAKAREATPTASGYWPQARATAYRAAWSAVEAALVAAERERVPPPLYVTSGNHLSGYRVTLGYATLAEAQAAHEALARRALTKEPNG